MDCHTLNLDPEVTFKVLHHLKGRARTGLLPQKCDALLSAHGNYREEGKETYSQDLPLVSSLPLKKKKFFPLFNPCKHRTGRQGCLPSSSSCQDADELPAGATHKAVLFPPQGSFD